MLVTEVSLPQAAAASRMSSRRYPVATLPRSAEHAPRQQPRLISIRQQHGEQAADLAEALSKTVAGEVRFDPASRSLYASDLSIYRQVPIGVVIPRNADDVIATVAACREHEVPILGRGCGTSLSGQCCNVAVVIDFSKYMNKIRGISLESRSAWVEPGLICDDLRHAANRFGLTLAPDPEEDFGPPFDPHQLASFSAPIKLSAAEPQPRQQTGSSQWSCPGRSSRNRGPAVLSAQVCSSRRGSPDFRRLRKRCLPPRHTAS